MPTAEAEKPKFTPGPWRYRPFEYDDWGIIRMAAPDGALVAIARGGSNDINLNEHRCNKTDPYEANARLITAAPELLAALKALLPIADSYIGDFDAGLSQIGREKLILLSPHALLKARISDARALIARVEG